MDAEHLDSFIKEMLDSLESHIIQQPSMTHVIHSLVELQQLYQKEAIWVKKLLLSQLSADDFKHLNEIGQKLRNLYQLSLHDVLELVELAQDYCMTNFPNEFVEIQNEQLLLDIKQVKSQLAYGYFVATVEEFTQQLKNGFVASSKAMSLHKKWLEQLEEHFLNPEQTPLPEMEHSQCAFSKWLNTLEAKLIMHATGSSAFDLKGNILLAHRALHEEARFVKINLKNQSFFKALTHFDGLSLAFLRLDKYLAEAHFNYLSDPYSHFIDFVIHENKRQKKLNYYFVIHYGLIQQSELNYKQKKAVLEEFGDLFLDCLKQDGIDFISLQHQDNLHVVLNEQQLLNYDRTQALQYALKRLKKRYGTINVHPIRIKLFQMNQLPKCSFLHFDSLLNKMLRDSCEHQVCEIQSNKLEQYQQEVVSDLALLEVIQHHLDKKSFVLHYQPIVDQNGYCQTIETLIRLPMDNQIVQAENFLNIVEYHHMTLDIDRVVFELLKGDIPKLKGITPMVNVNIYPQSLGHPEFIKQIVELNAICQQNDIQLMVEITEHEALIHDEILRDLHQNHQTQFAIDDFGTGYSNLAKLAELAGNHTVQMAKLDGELIADIANDEAKLNVVRIVVEMASKLGLQPVIAEFVDSKEKVAALNALPSDMLFQGFFFSKALPLKDLIHQYQPKH